MPLEWQRCEKETHHKWKERVKQDRRIRRENSRKKLFSSVDFSVKLSLTERRNKTKTGLRKKKRRRERKHCQDAGESRRRRQQRLRRRRLCETCADSGRVRQKGCSAEAAQDEVERQFGQWPDGRAATTAAAAATATAASFVVVLSESAHVRLLFRLFNQRLLLLRWVDIATPGGDGKRERNRGSSHTIFIQRFKCWLKKYSAVYSVRTRIIKWFILFEIAV